ncbi:MAG: hypothetical protein KGL69_02520 [Alphaproteobacteria bacterium]|nr:hypothetical protein [Alphaproteobacteria bacterium]
MRRGPLRLAGLAVLAGLTLAGLPAQAHADSGADSGPDPAADLTARAAQALDGRIHGAAAAAEAEQGALDGAWVVSDLAGRARLDLVLADPARTAPAGAELQGAWSSPGAGAPQPIAKAVHRGRRLDLRLGPDETWRLTLRRQGREFWRGVLITPAGRTPVLLRRRPM